MGFQINISPELACAVISTFGVIVSALISRNISKNTAAREVTKMKMTWEREDIISSDDEFADMAATVARFVQFNSPTHRSDSMAKVAAARSKESKELGKILDNLYDAIHRNRSQEADLLLTEAITEKRKIKGNDSTELKK